MTDDAALQAAGDEIAARLIHQVHEQGGQLAAAPPAAHPHEQPSSVETSGAGKAIDDCWHISVRFGENVLRQGMDPAAILRHLLTLGEIAHIDTLADAMPPAAALGGAEPDVVDFLVGILADVTDRKARR